MKDFIHQSCKHADVALAYDVLIQGVLIINGKFFPLSSLLNNMRAEKFFLYFLIAANVAFQYKVIFLEATTNWNANFC